MDHTQKEFKEDTVTTIPQREREVFGWDNIDILI